MVDEVENFLDRTFGDLEIVDVDIEELPDFFKASRNCESIKKTDYYTHSSPASSRMDF